MNLKNRSVRMVLAACVLFLAVGGEACKKAKKSGEPAAQAPKSQAAKPAAKAPAKPRTAAAKEAGRTAKGAVKGYTLTIEDAVTSGGTLTVKVRVKNVSVKKPFKTMLVNVRLNDARKRRLLSLTKTVNVASLRQGDTAVYPLDIANPPSGIRDVKADIAGVK